jgi:hypothetical protein
MRTLSLLVVAPFAVLAADEMVTFDLQAPASRSYEIVYDASATREGAAYFFTPSNSSRPRVVDRATGKPLQFTIVDGKTAKAAGGFAATTPDSAPFLRVQLARPVPKSAETRIRISETVTDAAVYQSNTGGLVFDRMLSVKRSVVILPKGYEITGSAAPAIVSTDPEGRVHVSFLNDRDDPIHCRISARRLP